MAHRPHKPTLTDTQLSVLAAVEDLHWELGYAPTYALILDRLGWSQKSRGSLHRYLDALRDAGVIDGRGRSLRCIS